MEKFSDELKLLMAKIDKFLLPSKASASLLSTHPPPKKFRTLCSLCTVLVLKRAKGLLLEENDR